MKTIFGLFTAFLTFISTICTALWPWVGVVSGLYMGGKAFVANAGLISVLFNTFGFGLLFGIGTLVLGLTLTLILGFITAELLR